MNKLKAIVFVILISGFLFLTYACDEIEKQEKLSKKESVINKQLENLSDRMEMIFFHNSAYHKRDYYGLRDNNTGREYLVVFGQDGKGISIIELKPRETEEN